MNPQTTLIALTMHYIRALNQPQTKPKQPTPPPQQPKTIEGQYTISEPPKEIDN